ncbi:single-stranded-DNA-specific exonuclease RecJ [Prochlorococcus marinus XMU1408]|uniref:Single-stranded-DNA-specific exonuclease RecJ n=1 Tax=Prochlorococcus marinus XMU1408 TaxID=2213228 RepID=A0A318R3F0_PROMR|nr:single-stranded-DNA-specific exonuclease RecJ [Prochlorococcus marinus str. XMU1408]PYE03295.1 single-stranded-DNA-specific exonuclease RecJ [Prochlorococcus marinus XMU1408]
MKKWILPKPIDKDEIINCEINYTLQKILTRRGIDVEEELKEFITPSQLPNPNDHFIELDKATKRIIEACQKNETIAICGDYDADGITSTVLLVELFTNLGANAIAFIPSRQNDGYGLNKKIINEIYNKQIKLIITVDNGISALDAIERSNELDIDLIITDHHKIPKNDIDIFALIHPELTPNNSPYKYLAGVGIAYMLAKYICDKLNYNIDQTTAKVLFCIGTVADMAPLVGANRKWLKEYLPRISSTNNNGIKAIISRLGINGIEITSDDIGYKIAPLINAVGRIGDTKLIIDLLTNSSESSVKKLMKECFAIHAERKKLTANIEVEAIEIAQKEYNNNKKFLVITKRDWHPGIIGIVAARILEKFNLPTAILSEAKKNIFTGSIRSNNLLKVNLALDECKEILISHGGHSAAAGFSIKEENIPELNERLNNIAKREMKNCDICKSIKPDAYVCFKDINYDFFRQLMYLGPFGVKNPAPIFWTRKCRVIDLYLIKGNHLKITLDDGSALIEAIHWNSSTKLRKNDLIDIAFYIEMNNWKRLEKLQLNILDIRKYSKIIELQLHNRIYKCELTKNKKIIITNTNGDSITSDLSGSIKKNKKAQNIYVQKILSFAEIALGTAA